MAGRSLVIFGSPLVPTDSTKTPSHLIVILLEHPRNFLMFRPEECAFHLASVEAIEGTVRLERDIVEAEIR